jgi:hypothetical protein
MQHCAATRAPCHRSFHHPFVESLLQPVSTAPTDPRGRMALHSSAFQQYLTGDLASRHLRQPCSQGGVGQLEAGLHLNIEDDGSAWTYHLPTTSSQTWAHSVRCERWNHTRTCLHTSSIAQNDPIAQATQKQSRRPLPFVSNNCSHDAEHCTTCGCDCSLEGSTYFRRFSG